MSVFMWDDGTHIKDPPITYNCHIGVLAEEQVDMLEFRHAR